MPTSSRLGLARRALRARGFVPTGNEGGFRRFEGEVECRGQPVRLELYVCDWDFLSYPPIKVISGIDQSKLAPHVNPKGWLCYLQEGSVVLDRYRPDVALLQCLEQARHVLEQIKFNSHYRTRDVQDEFLSHWLNGPSKTVHHVLLATVDRKAPSVLCWGLVDAPGGRQAILADDLDEAERIANALGETIDPARSNRCWLFRSELPPAVPQQMPSTVQELFVWLRSWDRKLNDSVQKVLGTPAWLTHRKALFAIETTAGWLGFAFDVDPTRAKATKRKPTAYRQHLHGAGGSQHLDRLWLEEVGPEYVHSRNLRFSSLSGKSVAVVGCGAIGSHAAEGLIRLGAGSGGGELLLIDPERLEPANIGRHALGYPALFKPKASALEDELARHLPLAKLRSAVAAADKVTDLFTRDLIVDATGEEALSEQLNARRLESGAANPVLHVWIVGNGDAVQALWAQGREYACYRCALLLPTTDGSRKPRFPTLEALPERQLDGCRAFTPYAVGAPMAAAALALEMVADWLSSGSPRPRFRTRQAAHSRARQVKSQDPTRLEECPACG